MNFKSHVNAVLIDEYELYKSKRRVHVDITFHLTALNNLLDPNKLHKGLGEMIIETMLIFSKYETSLNMDNVEEFLLVIEHDMTVNEEPTYSTEDYDQYLKDIFNNIIFEIEKISKIYDMLYSTTHKYISEEDDLVVALNWSKYDPEHNMSLELCVTDVDIDVYSLYQYVM